jgi:hypothetical protein
LVSLLEVATERGGTLALTNQFMRVIQLCAQTPGAGAENLRAHSCRNAIAGSTRAAGRAGR